MKGLMPIFTRFGILGCLTALAWLAYGPKPTLTEYQDEVVSSKHTSIQPSKQMKRVDQYEINQNEFNGLKKSFEIRLSLAEEMYMQNLSNLSLSLEQSHLENQVVSEIIPDNLPEEVKTKWVLYVESLKRLEHLNLEKNGIDAQFLKMAKAGFETVSTTLTTISDHSKDADQESDIEEEDPSANERI